jgi:hypothetical protein
VRSALIHTYHIGMIRGAVLRVVEWRFRSTTATLLTPQEERPRPRVPLGHAW